MTLIALLALGVFAFLGWRARSLTIDGAIAGFLLAAIIGFPFGLPGLLLVFLFTLAGSAASRLPGGAAHESRSSAHALANLGAPGLCAAAALFTNHGEPWRAMMASALAFALSDTLATEFGTRFGGIPRNIVSWERVRPGENGGVSLAGSLAGIAGAFAIACAARSSGMIPPESLANVAAAGCAGNIVDSILGATIERRGLLGNHGVNFTAAVAAAGIPLVSA